METMVRLSVFAPRHLDSAVHRAVVVALLRGMVLRPHGRGVPCAGQLEGFALCGRGSVGCMFPRLHKTFRPLPLHLAARRFRLRDDAEERLQVGVSGKYTLPARDDSSPAAYVRRARDKRRSKLPAYCQRPKSGSHLLARLLRLLAAADTHRA